MVKRIVGGNAGKADDGKLFSGKPQRFSRHGLGARLDEKPDLLWMLRALDEKELIAQPFTP